MQSIKSLKSAIEKQITQSADDISIIELVDLLVEYAYSSRASDIHIEPAEKRVVIRLRIDGILQDEFAIPKELHDEIISRIKVLSSLKTDIHHVPQDGRFKAKIEARENIDIRVSIAPTYYDENAVLRILAETNQVFSFDELGFTKEQLAIVEKSVKKPYGMILVNGPTGSGKTTTLYTILKKLSTREISIITIEDPIEYSIEGVTQIPVSTQAGLTFANGLRSILRQDPNIIMVGEIRDSETANIAVNASLTGHLMLSTLHTNDAATTFPRLIDMGVPPFLVASTLNVAVAQRLVRKACPACKKERSLDAAELQNFGGAAAAMGVKKLTTAGKGCDQCNGTGYMGRTGIHEVLEVRDNIRGLIVARADSNQIKQAAVKNGMLTMIEDGLVKAREGITTIEEVLRIIYE